jgi:molybdate transport system permease protein
VADSPLFSEPSAATPVSGLHGRLFAAAMLTFVVLFVVGLLALIIVDVGYVLTDTLDDLPADPDHASLGAVCMAALGALGRLMLQEEILAALWLSLWTTAVTVVIGLLFAVPMGYALSRYRFLTHPLVDSIVDLPIILPPLVVGLSLLVFFQAPVGEWIEGHGLKFVFQRKGIVLCQLLVSASFGIRAIKLTFDNIDPRIEHVAMTLGCTRAGAFFRVALPMARRGIIVGAILIWTRAFGIFGPLMVFVGAVRLRTEVLPTTVYLEQSVGRIEVALAVAILMLVVAAVALVVVRIVGLGQR